MASSESNNNTNNSQGADSEMRKFRPLVIAGSSLPPPKKPNLSTNNGASSSSVDKEDKEEASGSSESMWMPQSDKLLYLQTRLIEGADPRLILQSLAGSSSSGRFANLHQMIPPHLPQEILWRFLFEIFSEPTPRSKLPSINTLDDVVSAIKGAKKILVVAGAGLSVSSGIPDFRSKDGLYSLVARDFPQLRDPQLIFDADYFKEDPIPFFRFAKHICVIGEARYKPSLAHLFIAELEKRKKLLRMYTQNIDGLEMSAGLSHQKVINCHGSFETSTCTVCRRKVDSTEIAEHINNGTIAYCKQGACLGVLKPDIVFFGESLPAVFHHQMTVDRNQADLVIVLGTSLRVRPVSLIPFAISPSVPQILINRERLRHMNFDVELLGDCDVVAKHLRAKLGWNEEPASEELPKFAFYPPNTYIFASSTSSSVPALDLSDEDDEEEELDSSDSDHSSPSPPHQPAQQFVEKRVLVKVLRTDESSDEPKTNGNGNNDSNSKPTDQ